MVESNTQGSLNFDARRSEKARDEGIARVEEAARTMWREAALEAVYQAALNERRFIVDEVWSYMPEGVDTRDLRAMGPVMRRAVKAGWITATSEYRNSTRVSAHSNPRRVWQSRLPLTGKRLATLFLEDKKVSLKGN